MNCFLQILIILKSLFVIRCFRPAYFPLIFFSFLMPNCFFQVQKMRRLFSVQHNKKFRCKWNNKHYSNFPAWPWNRCNQESLQARRSIGVSCDEFLDCTSIHFNFRPARTLHAKFKRKCTRTFWFSFWNFFLLLYS